MFEVNVNKIIGKISEKGYNKTSFSKQLGIDRNTLTAYLKTPDKIPYLTINNMANLLCDNMNEAANIFFGFQLTQNESQKPNTRSV